MEKILTAKEVFELETSENTSDKLLDWEKQYILDAMIEFAKMHVKEALKTALDETPYGSSTDTVSYEDCVHILDCYPSENIK